MIKINLNVKNLFFVDNLNVTLFYYQLYSPKLKYNKKIKIFIQLLHDNFSSDEDEI